MRFTDSALQKRESIIYTASLVKKTDPQFVNSHSSGSGLFVFANITLSYNEFKHVFLSFYFLFLADSFGWTGPSVIILLKSCDCDKKVYIQII